MIRTGFLYSRVKQIASAFLVLFVFVALAPACGPKIDGAAKVEPAMTKPMALDNGETIVFPAEYPGLKRIVAQTVSSVKGETTIVAPAKIIASITKARGQRIALFESQELTTLYAQHRTARINSAKQAKALARTRDMFEGQMVTRREVADAESDAASTKAVEAEMEARMRAYGIDPDQIRQVSRDTVWLIADIPESQLNEIRKGQHVAIAFAAIPNKRQSGKVEAIGENVDPLTRTVKARVSMTNEHHSFKPGMFAQVSFGEARHKVITLPTNAVVTVENQNYVFIKVSPERFARKKVETWNNIGATIGIASGLSLDDEVVVQGAMLLKGISFGY